MSERSPDPARDSQAKSRADPIAMTHAAERLRHAGDLAGAEALLDRINARFPHLPYGWRELGIVRRSRGDQDDAARCFARAFETDPADAVTIDLAVRNAAGAGQFDTAKTYLAHYRTHARATGTDLGYLGELVDYMQTFPEEKVAAIAEVMERDPDYHQVSTIEAQAGDALSARTGFFMIRLGDGEGVWMSDPDEAGGRFRTLYRRNRARILRVWFGSEVLLDRSDFDRLRGRFFEAVAQASVLGVTTAERIRSEYRMASPDGVAGCGNILRHLESLGTRATLSVRSQDIHLHLQHLKSLRRLMEAAQALAVISSRPNLPAVIAREVQTPVAAALLTPEEKAFTSVTGLNGTSQDHFPTVFEHIVSRIRARTWGGTLWLVAAGYLGKIYCHEIARQGGVALDIGSIADAWCGKMTRPTFHDLSLFRV